MKTLFCILLCSRLYRLCWAYVFFQYNEMRYNSFFTVNSPVIFLKYTFEFMFNMDQSALNGALCQWQFYGQGNKLNTSPTTCVTSSVVYSSGKDKLL